MRARYSLRNILAGFGAQIITAILGFLHRTVFIYTLSADYLGISSLFSNLLIFLNLAELGIGSAITFALYKPVAENDREKIRSLTAFYRKAYRLIGFATLLIGLGMLPFLPILTHGGTDLVNLNLVFVLYVLDTAFGYWFYSYLTTVLTVYQKNYVASLIANGANILCSLLQTALLLLLRKTPEISFYVYTVVGVSVRAVQGLWLRAYVRREYPFVLEKGAKPLTDEDKKPVFKNVVGMMFNKVSMLANDGIDSVVISSVMGLAETGIFSNYLSLRTYIVTFLRVVFNGITASVGDYCARETREAKEALFYNLQFAYFWLYGFCSICLWILMSPFIAGIWLGEEWLLSDVNAFLVAFNFLITGLYGVVGLFQGMNGLYWATRYRYVLSAAVNIGFTLFFVVGLRLGPAGALLGTTISFIPCYWMDPVILYRHVFQKGTGIFYKKFFSYIFLTLATGALLYVMCIPLGAYTLRNFALRFLLCMIVPNALWYLLYRRDSRFLYLRNTALSLLRSVTARLRRKGGLAP